VYSVLIRTGKAKQVRTENELRHPTGEGDYMAGIIAPNFKKQ